MTAVIEEVLRGTAAFAAIGAAGLVMYLVALRFVAWELVPSSAVAQCRWWQRHAPAFLLASLVIAAGALAGLVLLAIIN